MEHFAEEGGASGRYRDMSEIVAAGVSLLQRQETARAKFVKLLDEVQAQAEAERVGWHNLEDVMAEADEIIASMRAPG